MIERLNREIQKRTNVVGIFPNANFSVRLITTYLMEYAEDWSVSRAYLSQESIEECCLWQLNFILHYLFFEHSSSGQILSKLN